MQRDLQRCAESLHQSGVVSEQGLSSRCSRFGTHAAGMKSVARSLTKISGYTLSVLVEPSAVALVLRGLASRTSPRHWEIVSLHPVGVSGGLEGLAVSGVSLLPMWAQPACVFGDRKRLSVPAGLLCTLALPLVHTKST